MLSTLDKIKNTATNNPNLTLQDHIERLLDLTAQENDEINDLQPWALAASTNPNILSHSQAKKAVDWDRFIEAMKEEVQNMIKNNIFKIVKKSLVPKNQRILR